MELLEYSRETLGNSWGTPAENFRINFQMYPRWNSERPQGEILTEPLEKSLKKTPEKTPRIMKGLKVEIR